MVTKEMTVRAKAWAGRGIETVKVKVEDNQVYVWDDRVAFHWTLLHSLSPHAITRIRKLARKMATQHQHTAAKEGRDRAWNGQVPDAEGAAGNIVREQTCACGATRIIAINQHHRAATDWDESTATLTKRSCA